MKPRLFDRILLGFILLIFLNGIIRDLSHLFHGNSQILTKTGKNIGATVDVNKPVEVDGWKIYQYGYDPSMGAQSNTSILELVSDPWLPYVYLGIYMLIAGAVGMFLGLGGSRKRK